MVNRINNDKLDALIMMSADVLVWNNINEFLSTDTSDVVRPKALDRRILKMIRRERRQRDYGLLYTRLKQIVAALLIVCSTMFAMAMSIDAVRTEIWETIVQWYEEYFSVMYVTDDEVPTTIESKMEPKQIPNDWMEKVIVDSTSGYLIFYMNDDFIAATFSQLTMNKDNHKIDSDNTIVTDIKIDSYDGLLIQYTDKNTKFIVWSNGQYAFSLSTQVEDVSVETLIMMAESVE